MSYNCLDRHVAAGRGDKVAFHWEGEPGDQRTITYAELLDEVQRFANALKSLGVRRGDRVNIYLPMIPEAVAAMLACTRIGAPHSVVFGGFSAEALRDRITDEFPAHLLLGHVLDVGEAFAVPAVAGVGLACAHAAVLRCSEFDRACSHACAPCQLFFSTGRAPAAHRAPGARPGALARPNRPTAGWGRPGRRARAICAHRAAWPVWGWRCQLARCRSGRP